MQKQMEDIQVGEVILDAVRRYDASMSLAVPESTHADVNKHLVYPLRNYLRASGKRLRPLLCELGCERVWVEPIGRAIESFHSAALIHDDIEDASSLRRGLPAYSDALRLRVVNEFVDTALRTIEGQAVDISVEECL